MERFKIVSKKRAEELRAEAAQRRAERMAFEALNLTPSQKRAIAQAQLSNSIVSPYSPHTS